MKRNPLRQEIVLFHAACGGIEADDFAPYLLPNGESIEWRIKPLSATQIGRIDLYMREGRRAIDLRPGRPLAILPFLRCFGPRFPMPMHCAPPFTSSAIPASSARPSNISRRRLRSAWKRRPTPSAAAPITRANHAAIHARAVTQTGRRER